MSDAAAVLPSNATDLERALVTAAARATDVPVPIREIWDVDTCPESLLPYLAWSLAVPTWNADWPIDVKRSRIRTAVDTHKHKGTAGSVKTVLRTFGGALELSEWWQRTPRGVPHTFTVALDVGDDAPTGADYQDDIIDAVDRVKPVRASYDLIALLRASGQIGVIGAARGAITRRLTLGAEASVPVLKAATFDDESQWTLAEGHTLQFQLREIQAI